MLSVDKISNQSKKVFRYEFNAWLKQLSEKLKNEIINRYDELLVFPLMDVGSRANPAIYREEFIERLENFKFIESNDNSISLNIPNMNTFSFAGRLKVIETILNGVVGDFIEVDQHEFKSIFGELPANEDTTEDINLFEDRIYLVEYNNNVIKTEYRLKKKFVHYPFSNLPPIDLFEEVEAFVDKNMDSWVKSTVDTAYKGTINMLKGTL